MRATALGIAGSLDANVQFLKSANESAPVHSQRSSGSTLIPINLSKDNKNKLLSKFVQRFGIEDACPVHPQHQCLKLRLRGIRMFSTHVSRRGYCIAIGEIASTDYVRLMASLVNYVRMVQLRLPVRRRELAHADVLAVTVRNF